MQIQSVSSTANAGSKDARHDISARDGLDFMKLLTESLSDSPAEVSPDLDIAAAYTPANSAGTDAGSNNDLWQTAEAPYSGNDSSDAVSTDTIPLPPAAVTPVEDIRLTDSELHDVVKELKKQGADDETLARVVALAGNPGGVTVADVIKAVANPEAAKLTDGDLQRIASFADRLDPTGGLRSSLLDDIRNGRTGKAFSNLMDAMNRVANENPGQTLSMDKNELLSLGKGLKLDAKTMEKLEKAFNGKETLRLTAAEFRDFTAPLQVNMQEQAKNQEKLAGVLEKALTPTIAKARKRLEKEEEAAGKVSRTVQQSESLIRDTVTRTVREQTQATMTGKADAAEAKDAKETAATQRNDRSADEAENIAAKDASSKQGADNKQDQNAGKNKSDAFASTADARTAQEAKGKAADTEKAASKGKEDPWDALLRKLDVQAQPVATTATVRTTEAPQPLTGGTSINQLQQAAQPPRTAAPNATGHAARVLSQVEQGVFSALADGTKRLTLNLNPVELGAVSVILSSRNGEVSATLRPERPETAAMLAQQADALRANLEQQGIKVDKVDVQTPQNQNNSSSWSGMEQHNASQEKQARQDALDRMRRLGRVRDAEPATFNASPQAMRASARASTSSLNLIA